MTTAISNWLPHLDFNLSMSVVLLIPSNVVSFFLFGMQFYHHPIRQSFNMYKSIGLNKTLNVIQQEQIQSYMKWCVIEFLKCEVNNTCLMVFLEICVLSISLAIISPPGSNLPLKSTL